VFQRAVQGVLRQNLTVSTGDKSGKDVAKLTSIGHCQTKTASVLKSLREKRDYPTRETLDRRTGLAG
jgi:hypothetical protein